MTLDLSLPDEFDELRPRITVIGVGGAGGNAVNNMIRSNLTGVEFMAANTDSQALRSNQADHKIQLGLNISHGLGAGSRPDIGRAAAEEALDDILAALDGCHMVFITAGMGGGTGTGAAPVIARAARENGILTVGVVTKPFHFEGRHRMRTAEAGIDELASYVDTLIVIPNQNLFRIASDKTTFAEAFHLADDVLHSGVRGVTDLMVKPGLINLDFADIRAVMREMGKAMMGTGESDEEHRAVKAAEAAISNPLLDDASMKGARGVLINITGGPDMTLFEVDEAANRIRDEVDPEANIIFGATTDETLEGKIRVSVVATGIDGTGTAIHPVSIGVQEQAAAEPAAETVAEAPVPADAPAATPASVEEPAPLELEPAMASAGQSPAEPAAAPVAVRPSPDAQAAAELHRPARSSLWSLFGGRGKQEPANGAQPKTPKRDDMFVPPPVAVAPREIASAESTVRPIESAPPPANNRDVANGASSMFNGQNGAAQQAPPKAVPAAKPAEAQQAAFAVSEDVLEIPAFLRRQAN
jgi:cell division protein FtsZ